MAFGIIPDSAFNPAHFSENDILFGAAKTTYPWAPLKPELENIVVSSTLDDLKKTCDASAAKKWTGGWSDQSEADIAEAGGTVSLGFT